MRGTLEARATRLFLLGAMILVAAPATALAADKVAAPPVPGERPPEKQEPAEPPSPWMPVIPPVLEQMPREDIVAARYTYKLPSNEQNGSSRFDDHEVEGRLSIGYPFAEKVLVGLRTVFDADIYQFYTSDARPDLDLYHLELDTSLGFFVTPDDLVLGTFTPCLNSDFKHVTGSDWQYFGGGLWAHRCSPTVEGIIGVAALNDYRKQAQVLPLIGITWRASERWYLDVLLPEHAHVEYLFADSWVAFFRLEAHGGFYVVESSNNAGKTRLETQEIWIGPGVTYRFRPGLEARAYTGLLTLREWKRETFANGVSTGDEKDVRVREGLFLSFEIALTPDFFK